MRARSAGTAGERPDREKFSPKKISAACQTLNKLRVCLSSHSTMSEHLSQSQLAGYTGRTLYPDELLAVDSHLASCDECHERLTRIMPGTSVDSGEEPFHLDYDEKLHPYVDGTANEIDRELVDSHVAQCSRCADELRDLLAFREQQVPAAVT